jgi:hypothetical protein
VKAHLPDLRLIVVTAAVAATASLAVAVSQPATVDVDGQRIVSDVAPVTAGGVAYLPLRAVTEAAGAVTAYDPRTGELSVRRGTEVLVMHVGDRHATLNGSPLLLAHAPFTVHGRAMIRGNDLALALGSAVKYDASRGRIDVRTPGAVVAGAPDDSP